MVFVNVARANQFVLSILVYKIIIRHIKSIGWMVLFTVYLYLETNKIYENKTTTTPCLIIGECTIFVGDAIKVSRPPIGFGIY